MSSKRRERRKKCEGKKKFINQSDAIGTATYNTHKHGTHFTAYRCRYCGSWHVGHTPANIMAKIGYDVNE